jgi:site-specific DNA recombinase
MEDLKRGLAPNGKRLDGLVVYDVDRLTRDLRHLEDAIDVVMHYGRPILDTTASIDLLTENGRSTARIMVTMAGNQSAAASRRQKRKHGTLQQAGIPTGGRRPFGWLADKRTLHPEESKELRAAVLKLIEGKPFAGIVVDWTDRGILTPSGKRWESSTLKPVFRNPRICGYRARVVKTYNPAKETESVKMEIVKDAEGNPVMGQWQGIITPTEWETLMGVIGYHKVAERGKNSRIYLLSGILRCGRDGCNAKLRAVKATQKKRDTVPGSFHYQCPAKSAGGCGGVGISGLQVDELIKQAVIAKHEYEATRNSVQSNPSEESWDGEELLKQNKEEQEEAKVSRRRTDGKGISAARYFAILAELEIEEAELIAQRRAWLTRNQTKKFRPTNMRNEWNGYPLSQKRAYIEDVLAAVIVKPANGRKGQYADRLEPIWRQED